jgi:hypothetical protein
MDYKQKPLSDTTLKLYTDALNKIKKYGIDIDNINLNELEKAILENNCTQPTRFMLHKALLWHTRTNNQNSDIIDALYKIVGENIKTDRNKYRENKLSETEKDKYVDWEVIKHIYNKSEELYFSHPNNEKILDEYVLLSLYYLLHPRRLIDYLYMKIRTDIINREPDCILWTNEENILKHNNIDYDAEKVKKIKDETDISVNYLIINENISYFLFNNYKTYKFYGSQMIEVPDKLIKIIKQYIDFKKINTGDLLYNMSKQSLINKLNSIFDKYVNKKFSINIIRHSRITNELSNPKITEKQKYIISQMMAHSLSTQSIYKKILESDSDEEINIIEKINANVEKIISPKKKNSGRPKKYNNEEERKSAQKEAKKRFLNKPKIITNTD